MAMASRTLNVSVDAYDALAARKQERESFTDVILRLAHPTRLVDLAGVLDPKETDALRRDAAESRRRSSTRSDRMDRAYGAAAEARP